MMLFFYMFHIQKNRIKYSMILLLRMNLMRLYIQIHHSFQTKILSLDGIKISLMQLGMVLGIQKAEGELGPSIRMSMLVFSSQIRSIQSGPTKFKKCYMMVSIDHLAHKRRKIAILHLFLTEETHRFNSSE